MQKLEDIGTIFRFLTPILIAIIGWTTIQYLSAINLKFDRIDDKFSTFLTSYHEMDKRVERLEYNIFKEEKIKNGRTK